MCDCMSVFVGDGIKKNINANAYTYANIYTYIHTNIHTHTDRQTSIHTYCRINTVWGGDHFPGGDRMVEGKLICKRMHTHANTYIHTYIHTYMFQDTCGRWGASPPWRAKGTYIQTHAYTR